MIIQAKFTNTSFHINGVPRDSGFKIRIVTKRIHPVGVINKIKIKLCLLLKIRVKENENLEQSIQTLLMYVA